RAMPMPPAAPPAAQPRSAEHQLGTRQPANAPHDPAWRRWPRPRAIRQGRESAQATMPTLWQIPGRWAAPQTASADRDGSPTGTSTRPPRWARPERPQSLAGPDTGAIGEPPGDLQASRYSMT